MSNRNEMDQHKIRQALDRTLEQQPDTLGQQLFRCRQKALEEKDAPVADANYFWLDAWRRSLYPSATAIAVLFALVWLWPSSSPTDTTLAQNNSFGVEQYALLSDQDLPTEQPIEFLLWLSDANIGQ